MSTEALADIQKILLKYKISAKVTTWCENGSATTKILLRDLAGSQLNPSPVDSFPDKKKKKSPSRIRRDLRRHKAYLEKKSGLPIPSDPTDSSYSSSRRITTPCRRNGRDRGALEKVGGSPIPQLDGGDDTSGGGWEQMDGGQSRGDKDSTETQDSQNMVKKLEIFFEELINRKKNDEKDIEMEEASFEDAAKWALNQKKKV